MREILFRGKQPDNGEWVEGGLVQGVVHELWQNANRAYVTVFPEFLSAVKLVEVDPSTVGQYTGLKDCRGQRIFEGDILRPVWGNEYFLVGWRDEYADFDLVNCTGVSLPSDHDRMEIVGTIHDNPELLGRGCVDG